jgi:hypothetical protein
MPHECHAIGCHVRVPPRMFMCRMHWYMLPAEHRARIWAAYVPGQEVRKDPSEEYLAVAEEAKLALARIEYAQPFRTLYEAYRYIRENGVNLSEPPPAEDE